MNLTMRALIAVVATAAIVGLAGAYLGAAALQDGSPDEPAAEPTPGDDTPSPAATTPAGTPVLTIPVCKDSEVAARTLAPTSGDVTKQYADITGTYTLAYPEEWEVCQVHRDPEIRDLENWINFIAQDQLPHASIRVYANPDSLALEKWIQEHGPIFLDPERMAEERTIAGRPALFTAIDAEGLPRGEAYVSVGDQIIFVTTLRLDEFERFAEGIAFINE